MTVELVNITQTVRSICRIYPQCQKEDQELLSGILFDYNTQDVLYAALTKYSLKVHTDNLTRSVIIGYTLYFLLHRIHPMFLTLRNLLMIVLNSNIPHFDLIDSWLEYAYNKYTQTRLVIPNKLDIIKQLNPKLIAQSYTSFIALNNIAYLLSHSLTAIIFNFTEPILDFITSTPIIITFCNFADIHHLTSYIMPLSQNIQNKYKLIYTLLNNISINNNIIINDDIIYNIIRFI
jgi:hypothetical protein